MRLGQSVIFPTVRFLRYNLFIVLFFFSSDESPPYIQCPQNIDVSANPDNDTTEVTWGVPVAVDNSGFIPVLTSDPAVVPPVRFPIGVTTVTYRAEDLSENVAKCKFYVTVNGQCMCKRVGGEERKG